MKAVSSILISFVLITFIACKKHDEPTCPVVNASHILRQAETSQEFEDAQDTAEVIIAKLHSGQSFADLALQYGFDDGTKKQGGNLGWFTRGRMVQPFEDSCFNATVNKPFIVKTQYGVHVVNVNAKEDVPCY